MKCDIKRTLWMIHKTIISDSKARISGSRERHVQSGSRLTLSCRIEEYTGPPTYVFWYRNSEVINYSERKSILISSGRSHHLSKQNGNKFKNTLTTANVESSRISNSPTSTSMLSNENDSISKNYRQVFDIITVNFDPNQYTIWYSRNDFGNFLQKVQNNDVIKGISNKEILEKSSLSNNKLSANLPNVTSINIHNGNRSKTKMHSRRQRKFKRRRRRRNVLVSTLDIFDVSQTDGGVYTCAPSNAKNHSVMVHVVKGMIQFFFKRVTHVI